MAGDPMGNFLQLKSLSISSYRGGQGMRDWSVEMNCVKIKHTLLWCVFSRILDGLTSAATNGHL